MDKTIEFNQVVDRCCGLDVHKKVIVATVEGTGIARETREFSSTTRSLTELKEWLLSLGCYPRCDGEYWRVLEAGNQHTGTWRYDLPARFRVKTICPVSLPLMKAGYYKIR